MTTPLPSPRVDRKPVSARPVSFLRSRARDAVFNVLVLGGLWVVYALVRAVRSDVKGEALRNAEAVLRFQSHVGLDIEQGMQTAVHWAPILIGANTYYLVHFPLTLMVLAVAYLRDRHVVFVSFRNGLVAVTAAALVLHLLVPLAPPRMLDGFIDASALYGPDPYSFPGSQTANQFAAMPSLHVAWALLVSYAVVGLKLHRAVQIAAVAHAVLTVIVVVVTGHHFLADVLVAIAIVGLVAQVEKRFRRTGSPA